MILPKVGEEPTSSSLQKQHDVSWSKLLQDQSVLAGGTTSLPRKNSLQLFGKGTYGRTNSKGPARTNSSINEDDDDVYEANLGKTKDFKNEE